jgi:DNA-binding transcriptional MocR family regulator
MRRHPSREPPLHADPTRRTIVLGPRAHELRSYVGSTAWAVLEEMMQRSTGDGDQVVAEVSIRSLGSSLGLAKDTVNRAVRRLRDLGVIHAEQHRSASGVFQTGSYRLDVPTACLTVDTSTTTNHRRPHPTTQRRTTNNTNTTNTNTTNTNTTNTNTTNTNTTNTNTTNTNTTNTNTTNTGQLSLTFNP